MEKAKEKKGSKSKIGLLVVIFVILGGLGFYAYNSLLPLKNAANLQIELKDMEVISLAPLQIGLQIAVNNPGGRAIFPDADYDIYIEDIYIGSGEIQKTEILPGETKNIESVISVEEIPSSLNDALSGKTFATTVIDIKAHIKLLFYTLDFPLRQSISMDVSKLSQATKAIGILPLLQEYSEEKVEEALNSQEFLKGVREKTGEEITTQEAKDLVKEYLGEEALDMNVEDALSKYNLSQLR